MKALGTESLRSNFTDSYKNKSVHTKKYLPLFFGSNTFSFISNRNSIQKEQRTEFCVKPKMYTDID